jgi:hypothetical protein
MWINEMSSLLRGAVCFSLLASCWLAGAWAEDAVDPAKICGADPKDPRCVGYIGSTSGFISGAGNTGGTKSGSAVKDNARYVIFLHAGGGAKEAAEKLKEALTTRGFTIGGVDDKQDLVGGAGVDYFSEQDRVAAGDVADSANAALPPAQAHVMPRFQKIQNPLGFLGVWLYNSATKLAPANWAAAKPAAAWCYQEQKLSPKPGQNFFVACHYDQEHCERARGTNNPTPGTSCAFIDLSQADWSPKAGGIFDSWYQYSDHAFGAPFPQI